MPELSYADMLEKLVALNTTCDRSNLHFLDFVESYLRPLGFRVERFAGETPEKGNLWATIGPADAAGYVFSGHSDTVPVAGQRWSSDPYRLRSDHGRLYGRGTTDMKGFLAVCLAHAQDMAHAPLQRPIHFAISCDEELGCRGIPYLLKGISGLSPKPLGCFVGEPTGMRVVTCHKGSERFRTTFRGTTGHTSGAPKCVNAVEWAAELAMKIRQIGAYAADQRPRDTRFDIPYSTLLTTTFHGGTARNIVPDLCVLEWECRSIPSDESAQLPRMVVDFSENELLPRMKHISAKGAVETEQISRCLSLDIADDHDVATLAQRLIGQEFRSVNFGTEAGFFAEAGIPAVVVGPGSIEQAHTADEYIEADQLEICGDFVSKMTGVCCQ